MELDIKFSIITPVYNVEKFLDQCIRSVIDQTYVNYELILIDDGSKDGSGIICDFYAAKYSNIKAYHKSNMGQLHTREYGISKATGDYYVFLDSDDYLQNNALQVIYDTIILYNADCVFYGMQRVLDGVVVSTTTDDLDAPLEIVDKRTLYKKIFNNTSYNSLCCKALKATLVTDVDYSAFYQVRHGEDLLQSIEMLFGVSKAIFIPEILYNYRINPESVTQSICYESYTVNFQPREYVVSFLKRNAFFTEEDFFQYRAYAISLVIDEIIMISSFDTKFENKKRLFEQIIESSYYKEFLNRNEYNRGFVGRKGLLFVLFRKKQFRIIVTIVECVRALSSLFR